mmetsp:Transcript_41526/g.93713  ORF Transcript_41526/g.93713 Transcript_41526/m.93713 type:complete len:82 (+) Transcript_41526:181-426(+)
MLFEKHVGSAMKLPGNVNLASMHLIKTNSRAQTLQLRLQTPCAARCVEWADSSDLEDAFAGLQYRCRLRPSMSQKRLNRIL